MGREWSIYNGNIKGNEKGEFTFKGRGKTVTDYVMVDQRTRRIKRTEVAREIESKWKRRGRRLRKGEKIKMGEWKSGNLLEFERRIQKKDDLVKRGEDG